MKPSINPSLRQLRLAIVVVAVMNLPLIAVAQSSSGSDSNMAQAPSMPMTMPMKSMPNMGANGKGRTDMMQSMMGTQEKMHMMKMTGDPDYDFAEMMRMHHQGAVNMAQMELEHGKNPAMRNAAKKIIATQNKEIAEFDSCIEQHKPLTPAPSSK